MCHRIKSLCFRKEKALFIQLSTNLLSPSSIPYLSNSGKALCTSYWPAPRLLASLSCKTTLCQASSDNFLIHNNEG